MKCALTMDDHLEQYPLIAASVNMHIHIHIHTHIHTCICMCIHIYTYAHTYTQTYTYAPYIHTCIYHTVALISHTSKVMLKILQAKLQQYVTQEFQDV